MSITTGPTEAYYVVQYRSTGHDDWKDDNVRLQAEEQAKSRLERCRSAKIFRGAQWRVVRRRDEVIQVYSPS